MTVENPLRVCYVFNIKCMCALILYTYVYTLTDRPGDDHGDDIDVVLWTHDTFVCKCSKNWRGFKGPRLADHAPTPDPLFYIKIF